MRTSRVLLCLFVSALAAMALPACGSELYEPNDSMATAAPVDLPFSEIDLRVSSSDDDFFEFTLAEATDVHVLVTFVDDLGDIDIELLDASGATIQSSRGVSDSEELTVTLEPGTYYLRVYAFGFDVNDYDVLIETL